MSIVDELNQLRERALAELSAAADLSALAEWKSTYLGKQGALTKLSRGLGTLPPEERPAAGQQFNATRQALEQALANAETSLKHAAQMNAFEAEQVDVTLPGRAVSVGRLHPSTQTLRAMAAAFAEMGFQVFESPEVETDEMNFGLLNLPPDHPARDMWDTFYLETPPGDEKVLLRTHTSPGQIRAMRHFAPKPVRVILPGKVYRYEQVTARSEMQFHQVEGLAVGENITFADLKGTLISFAERLFGKGVRTRFRPSYFPFTEPSVELDVECFLCGGKGCRLCKHTGWLEILGAGMVHPTVLRNGGYDPEKVSGFAFGMGPERIAMLRYGIDDIRLFFSGDERFLEQF
ncbi:MAG: phenylalanine--tRNA ligase subunit alpha [Chloroflexota bacterium]|nr:MAG: phenylalanine--tRNA ligase subunit alpha [Chloroflexota bacterium]